MPAKPFEIIEKIKSKLENVPDTVFVTPPVLYQNKPIQHKKVITVYLNREIWYRNGVRPFVDATFYVDGFYQNAPQHLEDFYEWIENIINVLQENWDMGLEYVLDTDIISMSFTRGYMNPFGYFSIELRVRYYRDARNF